MKDHFLSKKSWCQLASSSPRLHHTFKWIWRHVTWTESMTNIIRHRYSDYGAVDNCLDLFIFLWRSNVKSKNVSQQVGCLREQISAWDCLQHDTFPLKHGSSDTGLDTYICWGFREPISAVSHTSSGLVAFSAHKHSHRHRDRQTDGHNHSKVLLLLCAGDARTVSG